MLLIFKIILIIFFIVIILYLLAVMPKLSHNPITKQLDGWLYAHRGLHDNKTEAPENSLLAFSRAVEHGYGIELDVQLTKDLVPIVLHDYNLKRACNIDVKVADYNYEELQKFRLFNSQEKIPTFREVLDLVNGKVPLIVELKIPWKADRLGKAVSDILKDYTGLYCIESFNPFGLIWYRKNYPQVVRGQLATDFIKEKTEGNKFQYFILKHLLMNFLAKPDFIAYHHIYKKDLSFTICRKLFQVKTVAWTIQSQEDYENSGKYFEWFIFDSFLPEDKKMK
jgi:glycerophosphoryl diester phosphodiesterase